jgi:octaprenyl-diphosphate synthase
VAFQLIDDALDYSAQSEELGKNVGDDLAEGKPTLPLIRALEVGSTEQKKLIRDAIENGDDERFEDINQAISETGALQYTIDQAQFHADQAKLHLVGLPQSTYKQALVFLADYAVERRY